ncbi:hypothetical protein C0991_012068 [Blastosporella zonata]|nr:hypothetical protein C0991_012068 [Blastosporella zonata]
MSEHVRTFVPIHRKDISLLRRAEEGVGETLSFPDLLMSQPSVGQRITRDISPEAEPMLSLPSPPVSSPTSQSAFVYDDELPSPPQTGYLARHSRRKLFSSDETSQRSEADDDQEMGHSPPSFASLSSPVASQSEAMLVDPPSPTFDSLVADAVRTNRQQPRTGSQTSRPNHIRDSASQISSSSSTSNHSQSRLSSASHDSVEKQLTQSMDIDNDDEPPSAQEPPRQDLRALSMTPGIVNERAQVPVRRQAWYGTRPPRRSSLATPLRTSLNTEVRGSTNLRVSHSTPSQLPNSRLPGHAFRSGTVQTSPSKVEKPFAYSQSQSQTQDSSFEYGSYPPLQTQAPYESQSFSP